MFVTQHRLSTYAHKIHFFYQMVCLWNIKATIRLNTLNMCLIILPMNHEPTPLKALLKGVKVIISFLKGMTNIHCPISYSSLIGWTHQPMKLFYWRILCISVTYIHITNMLIQWAYKNKMILILRYLSLMSISRKHFSRSLCSFDEKNTIAKV